MQGLVIFNNNNFWNAVTLDLVDPNTEFTVLSHMASHGFVVISPFTYYSLPTSQYNAEWMNHVDNWSQKNLQNKLVEEEGK